MRSMTANDAKKHFGQLLDDARRAPVSISKHGRMTAVILSSEEYNDLQRIKREHLKAAIRQGLDELDRNEGESFSVNQLDGVFDEIKSSARKTMS